MNEPLDPYKVHHAGSCGNRVEYLEARAYFFGCWDYFKSAPYGRGREFEPGILDEERHRLAYWYGWAYGRWYCERAAAEKKLKR